MSKQKIAPFLTFNGNAFAAMTFYAAHLPNAKIEKIERYGQHPMAKEGEQDRVLFGLLTVMEQQLMFLDMTSDYPAPSFNWSSSLYIDCQDEEQFYTIFNALKEEGQVMMGPEKGPHARLCAWVVDKFGITWQPVWQ